MTFCAHPTVANDRNGGTYLQVLMSHCVPLKDIRQEDLPPCTGPFIRKELGVDEVDAKDVGQEDDHLKTISYRCGGQ